MSGLLIYTQEEIKNTSGNPGRIQQTLPQRLQGMRARVNYGFDNRYLVEMSLTYTGSEKFARDHRWGVFPAMGMGYMLSNEAYWDRLKDIIPQFKLKYQAGGERPDCRSTR